MMKILLPLSLILTSFLSLASDPIWVKDGSSYAINGELTLKKSNGVSINTSLNKALPTRQTLGRTPNIMVVGSGSYSWTTGFQMSDGTYYIYEDELGLFVPFENNTFNEKFEFVEEDISSLNTLNSNLGSTGQIRVWGTASCGNNSYSGSCSITCGSTVGNENISGTYCSAGDSGNNGSFYITSQHDDGFYVQASVNAYVYSAFNIPSSFKDAFGDSIAQSGSSSKGSGYNCLDDGSGNTCGTWGAYTSASVGINYYFTDDWMGTGIRVGAYDWSTTNGSNTGMYAVGNVVGVLPFDSISFRLNESATLIFILDGGDLYGFTPGKQPEVVMAGAGEYPIKAVTVTGTKTVK